MIPFLLAPVAFAVGAVLSYTPAVRSSPHAVWAFAAVGAASSAVWFAAIRGADQAAVFRAGLYWDAVAVVVYFLIPAVIAGVSLSPSAWAGACLVLAGCVLVHTG